MNLVKAMTGARDRVRLDFADIQGNVLRGYGFPFATYVFITVNEVQSGRSLLAELVEPVTTNEEWTSGKPETALNVALTYAGLEAVGVGAKTLAGFDEVFRQGMAGRAETLDDTGPSRPQVWDSGLGTGEAHILVTLNARHAESMAAEVEWLHGMVERVGGLGIAHEQWCTMLHGEREHFGFADGFAQPSVEGSGMRPLRGQGVPLWGDRWRPLKAGEFILGYTDEDGILPKAPPGPLGRNGTYMVYRKLYQDVALWRRTIQDQGRRYPGGPDMLAAKIVGRWPDGTPLVLSPDHPDAEMAAHHERVNDFRYDDDPDGLRCPLGAHVRRTYPRDALGWGGHMSTRHRMIRRGMPYGPELPVGATDDDGKDRGLIFVCFVADIARQFEVVQCQWCNDGNAFGLGTDRDYLLGSNDGTGKMTIQGHPPFFLSPHPSFVHTRGGEYLFVPGLDGLRALAQGIA